MFHRSGWAHWPMTRASLIQASLTEPHPIRRPVGAIPWNSPTWVASVRERITTVSAAEAWWPSNVMALAAMLSGPATASSSEVTTSPQGSIRLGT